MRGGGAFLNGKPLTGRPKDELEFLSIEATRAELVLDRLRTLAPITDRIRIMGAQAITFCHLAAGRTDGVAVPQGLPSRRLRRRAAARPRARLRDPGDRRPRAGNDPARPRGPLADRRRGHRGAGVADRRGGTLLVHGTHSRSHSRRARQRDRPRAAQAGDGARHGPRRHDLGRRRHGHDRAHRRRLPAAQLVPGAGRARGRCGRRASRR